MNATDAQTQAINTKEALCIVAAGPGSGKTFTLIERIARLIMAGIDPRSIVAITFTNAAAREIEKRLSARVGSTVKLGYGGTLHGFMLRLIQRLPGLAGFSGPVTVIDEAQSEQIISELISVHRWRGTLQQVSDAIKKGPTAEANASALDIIRQDYFGQLRQSCFVDFDSILHYGLKLIRSGRLEWNQYSHLFVDEFQDSSQVDFLIYRELSIANKFFVGDPDQSIYAFRGGKPSIMVNMLKAQDGLKVCLQANYRCGQEICDAANRLIAHNVERFDKRTISQCPQNGWVTKCKCANPIGEMNWIAGDIQKFDYLKHPVAILTRSNAQANEIASFIESLGLPVIRKVKRQFPNGWRLCSALLQFMANPDNDVAAYHYVRLSVGEKRANELKLKALAAFTTINEISFKFEVSVIGNLLNQLGERQIDRHSIDFVRDIINTQINDPGATINDLLCLINQEETREEEQGLSAGITVCTIHAAKGREFDTVYLPGWEEGVMPLTSRDSDIEEERRLAFVAVTRAKSHVLISYCERRKREWIKEDAMKPSRFIAEIFPE